MFVCAAATYQIEPPLSYKKWFPHESSIIIILYRCNDVFESQKCHNYKITASILNDTHNLAVLVVVLDRLQVCQLKGKTFWVN